MGDEKNYMLIIMKKRNTGKRRFSRKLFVKKLSRRKINHKPPKNRKTNRRKTNRRKTNRRKTNRKKTNRRKTNRRKTNRRKKLIGGSPIDEGDFFASTVKITGSKVRGKVAFYKVQISEDETLSVEKRYKEFRKLKNNLEKHHVKWKKPFPKKDWFANKIKAEDLAQQRLGLLDDWFKEVWKIVGPHDNRGARRIMMKFFGRHIVNQLDLTAFKVVDGELIYSKGDVKFEQDLNYEGGSGSFSTVCSFKGNFGGNRFGKDYHRIAVKIPKEGNWEGDLEPYIVEDPLLKEIKCDIINAHFIEDVTVKRWISAASWGSGWWPEKKNVIIMDQYDGSLVQLWPNLCKPKVDHKLYSQVIKDIYEQLLKIFHCLYKKGVYYTDINEGNILYTKEVFGYKFYLGDLAGLCSEKFSEHITLERKSGKPHPWTFFEPTNHAIKFRAFLDKDFMEQVMIAGIAALLIISIASIGLNDPSVLKRGGVAMDAEEFEGVVTKAEIRMKEETISDENRETSELVELLDLVTGPDNSLITETQKKTILKMYLGNTTFEQLSNSPVNFEEKELDDRSASELGAVLDGTNLIQN